MAAELLPMLARSADTDNNPYAGAKWFFYATGTTTPQDAYTTSALSVAHANPVVADSAGKFAPIYLDTSLQYRGVLKDASEAVTIFDIDPINSGVLSVLNASTGAGEIGFVQSGSGAVASTVQAELRNIAVTPQQFLAGGESISVDAGPAIRRALATGKPVRFPTGTYIVEPDPTSENEGGIGAGLFGWCIDIPSNATLIFDNGATIKGADGLQSWTRVVRIVSRSGVRIFGELRVDANVANRGVTTNEQMHGVFLYDCTSFHIDAIYSVNARGDNVYIGGTSNSRGTADGYIGRIYAATAGRKCLVGQAFDNVVIGSAHLDNTLGGNLVGGPTDATNGNCLDIEPDSWTGAVRNELTIHQLYTKGAGNDFSAGTTAAHADAMIVNIGDWTSEIVSRSTVPPLTIYAITLNIGHYREFGATSTSPQSNIWYAARVNADSFEVSGACSDAIVLVAAISTDRPVVRFGRSKFTNTQAGGDGFENRDGDVDLGDCEIAAPDVPLWNRGLLSGAGIFSRLRVRLKTVDAGTNYVVLVTKGGSNRVETDLDLDCRDGRGGSAVPRLVYADTGTADGLTIRALNNPNSITPVTWGGADTFYSTGPYRFACNGTPESLVTAPIGSVASRIDGGAATSFYVKESGTGNTGWVAK